jgi:hypothetical protein
MGPIPTIDFFLSLACLGVRTRDGDTRSARAQDS